MTTDPQTPTGARKPPGSPSEPLAGVTASECLGKAYEALSAAHSHAMDVHDPQAVDTALRIAAEWRLLGDSLHAVAWEAAHRASLEAFDGPLERVTGGPGGGSLPEAPEGPQTGTQSFAPRTVVLPDGSTVHLWRGTSYVEGEGWYDQEGSVWTVAGVRATGEPYLCHGDAQEGVDSLLLVRSVIGPGRYGGDPYPMGSVWEDCEGDLWIVTSTSASGVPRVVELPMMVEDAGDAVDLSVEVVNERFGPLVRTTRTA